MDDLIVENVKRGVVDVAKSEVSPPLSLPSHVSSRWRHASQSRSYMSSEADLEIERLATTRSHGRTQQVIQKQWAKAAEEGSEPVYVHGWLKDLSTGLIKDLLCSQGPDKA